MKDLDWRLKDQKSEKKKGSLITECGVCLQFQLLGKLRQEDYLSFQFGTWAIYNIVFMFGEGEWVSKFNDTDSTIIVFNQN